MLKYQLSLSHDQIVWSPKGISEGIITYQLKSYSYIYLKKDESFEIMDLTWILCKYYYSIKQTISLCNDHCDNINMTPWPLKSLHKYVCFAFQKIYIKKDICRCTCKCIEVHMPVIDIQFSYNMQSSNEYILQDANVHLEQHFLQPWLWCTGALQRFWGWLCSIHCSGMCNTLL